MSDVLKSIKATKEKINSYSKSFCLAKWQHANLYLHLGETHSCHHPPPHAIKLSDIKENPSGIHNTSFKLKERDEMLTGIRPEGCQYCWNVEDLGSEYISDRHLRNNAISTEKRWSEIQSKGSAPRINPEYVEVSFSNECNFMCGYCRPQSSSRFYNEIQKFGSYPGVEKGDFGIQNIKIFPEDQNPFLNAWWEWWPELKKNLNYIRITGGEPLMHKSTWKFLELLRTDPQPRLHLSINSNLGIPAAWVTRLINEVKVLKEMKAVSDFSLFTSIDTWGERAEYLRTGLDLKIWQGNVKTYLESKLGPVNLMITMNVLSISSFKDLLEKILDWRRAYPNMIMFDTAYLRDPIHYDFNILPKEEFVPYLEQSLQFMSGRFSDVELEKLKRVKGYMQLTHYPPEKLRRARIDFYHWFTEYDKRRNVNFLQTFPDYHDFFNLCKNEALDLRGLEL